MRGIRFLRETKTSMYRAIITQDSKSLQTQSSHFPVMTSSWFGEQDGEKGWLEQKENRKRLWHWEIWILSVGHESPHWCGRCFPPVVEPEHLSLCIATCVSPSEPLGLFTQLFSRQPLDTPLQLPDQDRFYLVGLVCVIKREKLEVSGLCLCFVSSWQCRFLFAPLTLNTY